MDHKGRNMLNHNFLCNESLNNDITDYLVCNACKLIIKEEFYLRVGSKIYHESCLQCAICHVTLNEQSTCFLQGVRILCRQDYSKYFIHKCSKCNRFIYPNDWIRRACEYMYHLTCFSCYKCGRQLSTGEEYALEDGHILCKIHVVGEKEDNFDRCKQSETKRIRTAFTLEQLQILQTNFKIDPNPDGQDLGWIAQLAGLSKRVTQIWFQNTRARQKKVQFQSKEEKIRYRREKKRKITRSNSSSSDDVINVVQTKGINSNLRYTKLFKH